MQQENTCLPSITKELNQVRLDLDRCGIGLLQNALAPEQVRAIRQRLEEQATAERHHGVAFLEDGNMGQNEIGPNQRVFGLIGKGEIFRSLAINKLALSTAKQLFGSSYGVPADFVSAAELDDVLLSSMTANIVGPASTAMIQHADQGYMPSTTPYAGVLNVIWLLTDFTAENGATLVAPGSHLADNPLNHFITPPPCVPVVAPAGTAVFLDGRTWHGTGENVTDRNRTAIFSYYCRPFMRQQENYMLTLTPELMKRMDDELIRLLGFRVWFTLGGIEGVPNGSVVSNSSRVVGELRPN